VHSAALVLCPGLGRFAALSPEVGALIVFPGNAAALDVKVILTPPCIIY
jgi:hypothetical protein